MRKLYLLLIFIIFLVSFTSALDSLGTFKQGQTVRIVQVCEDATYVTISSISFPNSTIAVSNLNMTSSGSGEYHYNFSTTSSLGRYDIRGISNGCDKTFATYFDVTSSGGNGLTFWIILIFSFAFIFLILSAIIKEELFVYISGICFLVAGVIIMIYGIDVLNDWTTRAIAFISLGLGFIFSIGAYIYNSYSNSNSSEEEF